MCLEQNRKRFVYFLSKSLCYCSQVARILHAVCSAHNTITVLLFSSCQNITAVCSAHNTITVHCTTKISYIQRAFFLSQRLQENEISIHLSPLHSSTYIQQNSVNLTHTGPDRCRIIEYSGLSYSSCTDLISYR
jgi:hypothetical protein